MLTGDNQITAKQIAKQINLEENNIISDVLPQDKEAKIRQLQNQGQKVAMVGDGIMMLLHLLVLMLVLLSVLVQISLLTPLILF